MIGLKDFLLQHFMLPFSVVKFSTLHKCLTLHGFALRCCCLERLFEIDDYFCILFSHPGEPLASGEVLGGLGHILGVHFADFEQLLETSPEQIILLVDSSLRQGIVNSIAQFFPKEIFLLFLLAGRGRSSRRGVLRACARLDRSSARKLSTQLLLFLTSAADGGNEAV